MLSKEILSIILRVFGMTQPWIEPWSPRPLANIHTHTHTHIYIYMYISGDSSLFLLLVPPPSVNFSSQPVVRGPKVSHYSCYCAILHCIAQIDKRTLHDVFFCKQSRYYIICSLVNTVAKIIFFPFKSIEEKRRCSLQYEKNMFIRIKKLMTIYTDTASSFNFA